MSGKTADFLRDSRTGDETIHIALPPGPDGTPRSIVLSDLYCPNHGKGHPTALEAYRFEGLAVSVETDARGEGLRVSVRHPSGRQNQGLASCFMLFDPATGAVSLPPDRVPSALDQELLAQVRAGLTPEHLALLRRRRQAQGPDPNEDWRKRDWTWLKRGTCVAWIDLFPKAEPWVFEGDGAKFLAEDQYCPEASCDCNDVTFVLHRIEPRGPERSEGVLLGAVKLDLRTGRSRVHETEPGQSNTTLLRITDALLASRPGLRQELDHRFRFMRGFASWLAEQRLANRPRPAAAAAVGRNDPCPCGSGRKFKKCCLDGRPAAPTPKASLEPLPRKNPSNPPGGGAAGTLQERMGARERCLESVLVVAVETQSVPEAERLARFADLERQFGLPELKRCLEQILGRGRENFLSDESAIYRQYRKSFSRFGGSRRFLNPDELDDLKAELSRLEIRRSGRFGGPPLSVGEEGRRLELRALTLTPAILCDDLMPEDPPVRPDAFEPLGSAGHAASVAGVVGLGAEGRAEALVEAGAVTIGDIENLIGVATDDRLLDGWPGERAAWAPMHAVRALGLLKAARAARPLLGLLGRPNDWISDLLPEAWAAMGPEAMPALWPYAQDSKRQPKSRGLVLYGLARLAQRHPAVRREVIEGLVAMLDRSDGTDRQAMSYAAFALGELKARDAWPAIERAFDRGMTDTTIMTKDDVRSRLAGEAAES